MYLELTAEQAALQKELRLYFETLMTPAVRECIEREGLDGEQAGSIRRRLGTDGWLGVGWPTEYGGRGQSPVEQLIFREEAERLGAPLPLLALDTIGPTLMKFGSEQQRAEILPRIVDGTMSFAVGYTEERDTAHLFILGHPVDVEVDVDGEHGGVTERIPGVGLRLACGPIVANR